MTLREHEDEPEPPTALADTVERFARELADHARRNDPQGVVQLGLQCADNLRLARVMVALWFEEYVGQGVLDERAVVLIEARILGLLSEDTRTIRDAHGTTVRRSVHDALADER
jgi:hypothetical protein